MEMRLAQKEDLKTVYALFLETRKRMEEEGNTTWSDGYPLRKNFAWDISQKSAYLFFEGRELVAYIAVSFDPIEDFFSETKSPQKALQLQKDVGFQEGESFLLLHRLMVRPSLQGRGYAEQVFQQIANTYPRSILIFAVFPENEKAIRAYERYGFVNAGIYPPFEYGFSPFYLFYKHPNTAWGSVANRDTDN